MRDEVPCLFRSSIDTFEAWKLVAKWSKRLWPPLPLSSSPSHSRLVGLPILSCGGTVLPILAEAIKPSHGRELLPLRGRNWKRVKLIIIVLIIEGLPCLTSCAIALWVQFSGPSVCIPCFIVIDLIIRRVRGPQGSTSIVTRFPA